MSYLCEYGYSDTDRVRIHNKRYCHNSRVQYTKAGVANQHRLLMGKR